MRNCICKQARSQKFAWGLFWILEKTSNDLDPDFKLALISLSRFFCPNFGDLQKNLKKGLHWNLNGVYGQN